MVDYVNFSVEELLSAVKNGDDDACAALIKRYAPLVDSAVSGSLLLMQDATRADEEELRQEALIKLYQSALRYDSEQAEVSFGLYAKICIKNRMISLVRRHNGAPASLEEESLDPFATAVGSDPSEALLRMEHEQELNDRIRSSLSPLEYEVYELYADGEKAAAIADTLGVTVKAVENALYRLRGKLQKLISP